MSYNIMRIKKIKDKKKMSDVAGHNFRLRQQENVDSTKSHLNQILLNNLNIDTSKRTGFAEAYSEHYKKLGITPKSNNVLASELIISASPGFFKDKSQLDIERWAQDQVEFAKKEFGEAARLAVLHLDEKTPHLHILLSTEIKSVKRYKNRYGVTEKETYGLNAKRWNKEFLRELHTKHFEHNQSSWGLLRGRSKSTAKHKPVKEYYAELVAHEQKLLEEMAANESNRNALRKAKQVFQLYKDNLVAQIEDTIALLEVVESKELTPTEEKRVNEITARALRRMGGKPPKPPKSGFMG